MALDDLEKTTSEKSVLIEPASKTQIEFFCDPVGALDTLYRDCEGAEQSIEFEQYIFADDASGNRFLKLFIDKARAGIQVRLMLDGIGSRHLYDNPLLIQLKKAGGAVHFYNTLGWRHLFTPSSWFPRTHNKVMLIDGHIAHVSSLGLSEVMRSWRELHARITGELAQSIEAYFLRLWKNDGRKYRISSKGLIAEQERDFRFIVAEPRFSRGLVYKELLQRISKAQKRICLVTPYFLPPPRLRRALKNAAHRGVDVTVVVSAITDVAIADHVSRSYFPALLRKGVKIFMYKPSILHAKYALVDDNWATIGSSNLDYLSLLRNREANIVIRDRATVLQLDTIYQQTLAKSVEANMNYWRSIPLHHRLIGYLGHAIRKVL